jgi:hypothetical protein
MAWRHGIWFFGGLFVAITTLGEAFGENQNPAPTVEKRQLLAPKERHVADNSKAEKDQSQSVFSSLAECKRIYALGNRVPRERGEAKIAEWNVRWFPDGIPGSSVSSTESTNVAWLACAVAWMNIDAIALVEVKSKPRSSTAMDALVTQLTELVGERYRYSIDECPDGNGLHLAWVWNEKRVTLSGLRMYSAINPYGESCAKQLRPGYGAQMKFPGGLDLSAIAVHFKSGTLPQDLELRRRSVIGLGEVVTQVVHETTDSDLLVLGDMNSMGCESCEGISRGSAELQKVDTALAGFHVPMRRVPSRLGCSHYYDQQPGLLDHFFVTKDFREVSRVVKSETFGYCATLACEPYTGSDPIAVNQLSDHCPIVLTLRDEDLD